MGRSPCCSKEGLNKGAWTAHEDEILIHYIKGHGEGRWRNLPKRAGLKRCGKSCRLRWLNYLRPGIKRGNISADEEELIIRLHKLLGNRWSLIAGRLPGRTDNEIKNYWNTNLGKKIQHRQENSAATAAARASKHNESNGRIMKNSEAAAAQLAPTSDVVVRTRATRCSKVFINPQFEQKVDPFDSNKESKPSTEGDWDLPTNQASASTPVDGLLPISENERTINNWSNFTLDVDKMGEFCPSDVLNFEFSDIGDLNYSKALSTSLDQPLIFSEEMLQDWTNMASNLQHSLVPLLENGEEWLVK